MARPPATRRSPRSEPPPRGCRSGSRPPRRSIPIRSRARPRSGPGVRRPTSSRSTWPSSVGPGSSELRRTPESGWRRVLDPRRRGRARGEPFTHQVLRVLVEVDDADEARAIADLIPDEVAQLWHGFGESTWEVLPAAIAAGHAVRVGLEDVLVLPDGRAGSEQRRAGRRRGGAGCPAAGPPAERRHPASGRTGGGRGSSSRPLPPRSARAAAAARRRPSTPRGSGHTRARHPTRRPRGPDLDVELHPVGAVDHERLLLLGVDRASCTAPSGKGTCPRATATPRTHPPAPTTRDPRRRRRFGRPSSTPTSGSARGRPVRRDSPPAAVRRGTRPTPASPRRRLARSAASLPAAMGTPRPRTRPSARPSRRSRRTRASREAPRLDRPSPGVAGRRDRAAHPRTRPAARTRCAGTRAGLVPGRSSPEGHSSRGHTTSLLAGRRASSRPARVRPRDRLDQFVEDLLGVVVVDLARAGRLVAAAAVASISAPMSTC